MCFFLLFYCFFEVGDIPLALILIVCQFLLNSDDEKSHAAWKRIGMYFNLKNAFCEFLTYTGEIILLGRLASSYVYNTKQMIMSRLLSCFCDLISKEKNILINYTRFSEKRMLGPVNNGVCTQTILLVF